VAAQIYIAFETSADLHSSLFSLVTSASKSSKLTFNRWAWQNPHITLHIPPESRIQHAISKKRSGHPKRPQHTVSTLLSNLHLLLRVPSFSRWPLEVRFFSENVHKAWLKWTKAAAEPLRSSIPIITDFPPTPPVGSDIEGSPKSKKRKLLHGIDALNLDYKDKKSHVERSKDIVEFEREGECTLCHTHLEHDAGIYTICPNPDCESVTHMTCLSKHFLGGEEDTLVPIKGKCPCCQTEIRWIDVVKELSLRMRGQKEVEKLLKVKRKRKGDIMASQAVVEDSEIDEDEEDDEITDELERLQEFNHLGSTLDMGDGWHTIDDSDSDTGSITSTESQARKRMSHPTSRANLGTVIEDSDWDDAEVLD